MIKITPTDPLRAIDRYMMENYGAPSVFTQRTGGTSASGPGSSIVRPPANPVITHLQNAIKNLGKITSAKAGKEHFHDPNSASITHSAVSKYRLTKVWDGIDDHILAGSGKYVGVDERMSVAKSNLQSIFTASALFQVAVIIAVKASGAWPANQEFAESTTESVEDQLITIFANNDSDLRFLSFGLFAKPVGYDGSSMLWYLRINTNLTKAIKNIQKIQDSSIISQDRDFAIFYLTYAATALTISHEFFCNFYGRISPHRMQLL